MEGLENAQKGLSAGRVMGCQIAEANVETQQRNFEIAYRPRRTDAYGCEVTDVDQANLAASEETVRRAFQLVNDKQARIETLEAEIARMVVHDAPEIANLRAIVELLTKQRDEATDMLEATGQRLITAQAEVQRLTAPAAATKPAFPTDRAFRGGAGQAYEDRTRR